MQRRTLLRRSGALGALALAGCLGQTDDDPNGESGSPENDPGSGDESTPTPTPTPTPEPIALQDSSFEVTGRENTNEQHGTADVEFDTETDRVIVTGTIIGNNGCKTAALDEASYDAEADQVTVAVITKDREDAGGTCTQSLVAIEYEVTLQFSGVVPKSASVIHDGDGVTSAAHGSSSASDGPAGTEDA